MSTPPRARQRGAAHPARRPLGALLRRPQQLRHRGQDRRGAREHPGCAGRGRAAREGEPRPGRARQRDRAHRRHRREPPSPRTCRRCSSAPRASPSCSSPTARAASCACRACCCIRSSPRSPTRAHFEPESEEYLDELILEDRRRVRRRRISWLVFIGVVIAAVVAAAVLGYQWTQQHYFVGAFEGRVAIYQGVQQDIGPIKLSSVVQRTDDRARRAARVPARAGRGDDQRDRPRGCRTHRRSAERCERWLRSTWSRPGRGRRSRRPSG